ncbi:MAG: SpoIIE family protein phosphatase [Leptolyngbya sp. Prado105]|nr:SpoIIE family protein phosphatase [Leptolyngbya sp. Prado105]
MFRILVIEDDRIIRKLLKKLLQNQGYEVFEATSGEEGLNLLASVCPALILCDWELPGIDAMTVCRTLKADSNWSDIYVIVLSAYRSAEHHIEALDNGANDFLSKPIQIDELGARLRAGLRVYQTFQEQRRLTQELKNQQARLESEIAEAAEYVRSLLPAPMDDKVIARSQFLPSRQLGGDCFDYLWLDSDFLAMYLLDVSGHGLGAALVSVSIQNILRAQILPDINFYQPGLVLTALNEAFASEHEKSWLSDSSPDRYFTIWYGVYNYSKQLLMYASAGHPPGLLLSGHSPNHQVHRLSDGIYELKQSNGERWNLNGFIDLVSQCHHSDLIDNAEAIIQKVQDLKCRQDFEDDCSLLQIKL